MSGLKDEECDSTNLLPTDGSRALSASRIPRDLKQPAAPPSESRNCAVITPFFKSLKHLNGNFVCFFSAYNILDETKWLTFPKQCYWTEGVFLEWVEFHLCIQNRIQFINESIYSYKDLSKHMHRLLQLGHLKSVFGRYCSNGNEYQLNFSLEIRW